MANKRTALLIDGGHVRATARRANLVYDPDFIEGFARECVNFDDEDLIRILYYDSPQYRGKQRLPVSGKEYHFKATDKWLEDLASRDLFAVRRGTIAFRGWVPKRIPIAGKEITDDDFRPNFEQKGVDMRVGLDIATLSDRGIVERIVLVSADSDMIPAMKHGRKAGIHIVAAQLPKPPALSLYPKFLAHCDFVRDVTWPAEAKKGGKVTLSAAISAGES